MPYDKSNDDKQRQIDFVKELSTNVVNEIVLFIAEGHIPAEWDGIELRWYLADRFAESAMGSHKKGGSRHRKYKNTVIVNNL